MTPAEREFAIQRLLDGRDALFRAIAGLSEAQQRFKVQPEDWSIADCVEHVAVVEDFLFPLVTQGVVNPNVSRSIRPRMSAWLRPSWIGDAKFQRSQLA